MVSKGVQRVEVFVNACIVIKIQGCCTHQLTFAQVWRLDDVEHGLKCGKELPVQTRTHLRAGNLSLIVTQRRLVHKVSLCEHSNT